MVAHHLAKVRVAGSNPVIRSRLEQSQGRISESLCRFGSRAIERTPGPWWSGRVVRQRPAKPCTRVRFPSPPRSVSEAAVFDASTCAISSAGERFPDTEEVTGSIPVSRTTRRTPVLCRGSFRPTECRWFHRIARWIRPRMQRSMHMRMWRSGSASPCQGEGRGFESRHPLVRCSPARLAQRESASLTRKRSLVQSQYRAPSENALQPRAGGHLWSGPVQGW